METLLQKTKLHYLQEEPKTFSILNVGVRVSTNNDSFDFPFENITKSTYLGQRKIKNVYVFIFLYFYLSFLFLLSKNDNIVYLSFYILTGLPFLYYYFWYKANTKSIVTTENTSITFIYEKNNKVEVDNFIEKIYTRRDEHLLRTYTRFSKYLPFKDQYDGIMFILLEDVINQEEFYYYFGKLNEVFGRTDTDLN